MPRTAAAWPYWSLFGASLASGTALILVVVWRLRDDYRVAQLTRETLVDALVLSLGILACLLLSGWAFASRPKPQRVNPTDQLWA